MRVLVWSIHLPSARLRYQKANAETRDSNWRFASLRKRMTKIVGPRFFQAASVLSKFRRTSWPLRKVAGPGLEIKTNTYISQSNQLHLSAIDEPYQLHRLNNAKFTLPVTPFPTMSAFTPIPVVICGKIPSHQHAVPEVLKPEYTGTNSVVLSSLHPISCVYILIPL